MGAHDTVLQLSRGPLRVRITGDGPPLIWSHGVFFPIDVDDHSTLGRVLSELRGFTVVRFDARGHGSSAPSATHDEHRWDRLADDLLELADALGFDRFYAGGISMGAAVTLHAALRAPERVIAQLLFALPTAWDTRPAEQARYRELLDFRSPAALAAHVRDDLAQMFAGTTLPAPLAAMVDWLGRASWTALSRVIAGAAESDLPALDALADLRVPTLIRPWRDDVGHPLSTAERLADALPDRHHQVLDGFDDIDGIRAAFAQLASSGT
jgi:pimeloyl-ACP methyl ester carboxylesterase